MDTGTVMDAGTVELERDGRPGRTWREAVTAARGPVATGPASRLERYGARALSDEELVSLVAGVRDEGVARRALRHGVQGLVDLGTTGAAVELGLRPAAAARLLAAVELGRRTVASRELRPLLRTPAAVAQLMRPHLVDLAHEELHILVIRGGNRLFRQVKVAHGSTDACPASVRDILAPAVAHLASAIILIHNHPSGDPEPSPADVALTRQVVEAAGVLGVQVLDHLIIARGGTTSLLERGLVDFKARHRAGVGP